MEARSISDLKEPYVKGPHVRYLMAAMAIGLVVVIALLAAIVLIAQVVQS